jgi:hypothetical protein
MATNPLQYLRAFSKDFKSYLRWNLENSARALQRGNPNGTYFFILINAVQDIFEP